jgi:mannose-6-phosphate isomerase-like protein (cupin superfamily)
MKIAIAMLTLLALAAPAATISGDKATAIPAADVTTAVTRLVPQAQSKGSSGTTLARTGNLELKLSVRTSSGGAEVHAHYDDLMIVERGSATLITGGTVIGGTTGADGETHGSGIEGGVSKTIGVGDVVIVPAGQPHQLLIPPGTVYAAMVAKIKE